VVDHLRACLRISENGWSIHEAGMAQLDDIVGALVQKLKDEALDDNTIVVFAADNGTENLTSRRVARRPSPATKAPCSKAAFAFPASRTGPAIFRPVKSKTASCRAWIGSRPFVTAAGDPNIVAELKAGKQLGDTTDTVHLDGYDSDEPHYRQGAVESARDLPLR
jgi:arylsulfatase A-like enzyme